MFENILEKIESLPPLPQTIIEIEEFRKNSNKELEDLIKIIEKDPLCVTTLLKVSNSSLFGFKSKIETVSKVINLLGMNFTIYVAINESINSILKTDLFPYGISCENFMEASNLSLSLVNLWIPNVNRDLKDEILLAALLQESGKFILSEIIINRDLKDEFVKRLNEENDAVKVEKEILEITTSQITAQIFKHWKLSENLIKMIEFVDDIEKCDEEYKQKAQILDVIKTICDVCNPFGDKSINKGLEKAKKYNLNVESLEDAIFILKDRLNK
ncbi:HDOD domain-containing protein [Arcobacter cloacae]|uniref:HDOD domain-containing protein n=1 Tax=Arcobacter cloacae TaxID=1054034 RepID=A0A4Q0ZG59_9BACT|nr:HDOD domain-containing protein [Arcobacter cloacae]RXJ85484.1 HDOD domain-containing protein [Arcobacter cloacae]